MPMKLWTVLVIAVLQVKNGAIGCVCGQLDTNLLSGSMCFSLNLLLFDHSKLA